MDKKIFSFVVILSWCLCFVPTNQGLCAQSVSAENSRVEQEITSEGGGGLELNLPYGYRDFIPGVTAKISLPLELHPWENPSVQDVATAIKLYWSNRLQVYGGNVSFGGPTSLFTTAAPTMTVNPLAAFSFPAASVTVGLPGFNGSSAVYGGAVVASLGKGFAKDRISLWATGSQQKRFFGGLAVPLTLGEVQLQFSSAVGVWFLEDRSCTATDTLAPKSCWMRPTSHLAPSETKTSSASIIPSYSTEAIFSRKAGSPALSSP